MWDTNKPAEMGVAAPPNTPADLLPYYGGTFDFNGHTEWVEGDVHETGFTTTFTPIPKCPIAMVLARTASILLLYAMASRQSCPHMRPSLLEATIREWSTLPSRWSVRTLSDEIELQVWRGQGTRAGNEAATTN